MYGGSQWETNLEEIMGEGILEDQLPGDILSEDCDPPCGDGEFCIYNECIPEDSLLAPSWLTVGSFTIVPSSNPKVPSSYSR